MTQNSQKSTRVGKSNSLFFCRQEADVKGHTCRWKILSKKEFYGATKNAIEETVQKNVNFFAQRTRNEKSVIYYPTKRKGFQPLALDLSERRNIIETQGR